MQKHLWDVPGRKVLLKYYLELLDVITEIADDLYYGCSINEYTRSTNPRDWAWEEKYADITYPGKKKD